MSRVRALEARLEATSPLWVQTVQVVRKGFAKSHEEPSGLADQIRGHVVSASEVRRPGTPTRSDPVEVGNQQLHE
jgi:hypothetical protein